MKFHPPLDLPPPKGMEREWDLLRIAQILNIEIKYKHWDDLVNHILIKIEDLNHEKNS
jgi:hypothetical protein